MEGKTQLAAAAPKKAARKATPPAKAPVAAKPADLLAAFAALPQWDWGQDSRSLDLIAETILATYRRAAVRRELENRLIAALEAEATPAARQFICRQLNLIGTAACVPALAAMLGDKDLSHLARYALERIPDPAAVAALREALPKASGAVKIGLINSIGGRGDTASVPALIASLNDGDPQIAAAAASALGKIGARESADALLDYERRVSDELRLSATNACLAAAEKSLERGDARTAEKICGELNSTKRPRHVKMAVLAGLIAVNPARAASLLKGDAVETAEDKAMVLANAMRLTTKAEQKKTLLSVAGEIRAVGTLQICAQCLNDPAIAGDAAVAVVKIARSNEVKRDRADLIEYAMRRIVRSARDEKTKHEAGEILKGLKW